MDGAFSYDQAMTLGRTRVPLVFDFVYPCFLFTHSETGGLKVLILHSDVITNHVEPARDFVFLKSRSWWTGECIL